MSSANVASEWPARKWSTCGRTATIPCCTGAYGTMSGPFTILDFEGPNEQPVVYLEHPLGGVMVEDGRDVERFTDSFGDIAAQAMTTDDSVAFIEKVASELPAD